MQMRMGYCSWKHQQRQLRMLMRCSWKLVSSSASYQCLLSVQDAHPLLSLSLLPPSLLLLLPLPPGRKLPKSSLATQRATGSATGTHSPEPHVADHEPLQQPVSIPSPPLSSRPLFLLALTLSLLTLSLFLLTLSLPSSFHSNESC